MSFRQNVKKDLFQAHIQTQNSMLCLVTWIWTWLPPNNSVKSNLKKSKLKHISRHSSERGMIPPFIFDPPLLGIPPLKKFHHPPLFNKNFRRSLSSLIYTKSNKVHVRVVQREVWSLFFCISPWKSLDIPLFSLDHTWPIESVSCKKELMWRGVWTPLYFWSPLLGIPP